MEEFGIGGEWCCRVLVFKGRAPLGRCAASEACAAVVQTGEIEETSDKDDLVPRA